MSTRTYAKYARAVSDALTPSVCLFFEKSENMNMPSAPGARSDAAACSVGTMDSSSSSESDRSLLPRF